MNSLESRLSKVEEVLNGNGEPGLKARLRKIEEFVLELKNFHKVMRNTFIGSIATIVVSVVVAMMIFALRLKT